MQELILSSLRHFVAEAGVDGFRFDLAPALGRTPQGFEPDAPLLRAMREDSLLNDRVMIAEPWDIGPGGYQLGRFGEPWLEWNDRYRDDVRRFWRGDAGMLGPLATRLSGSSDLFWGSGGTVNFIAAHDGFTLADLTAYEHRHNEANGDPAVAEARRRDVKALLSTLFCSRGTIMLTAGDELGRTQHGNNNAYAQDNVIGWVDWEARDREIEAHAFAMAALRADRADLSDPALLTDADVEWLDEGGQPLSAAQWEEASRRRLVMRYRKSGLAICINGGSENCLFSIGGEDVEVPARSISYHG
jgi:glycogen operon protein